MKSFTSLAVAIICSATVAFAQPASTTAATPNPNAAEIVFKTETHDFGTVKNGADIGFEYEFTNTGKEPLILADVHPACGCTTPTWSKEPIAPGKSGKILVKYDTKRVGQVTKTVSVTSNAKSASKTLSFTINVLAPEGEGSAPLNTSPAMVKP